MFANRFTAFVDACALAGALKRNLLLTLAEAEFFQLRWSERVLDETQKAIEAILDGRGRTDAAARAKRARASMENAFEDALVTDYDRFLCVCEGLPDPGDAHVIAAALKTQAAVIVTDNLSFPPAILRPLNIEARSSDTFAADTIALDPGRAVASIKLMRQGFQRPDMTADALLTAMEAVGLPDTVDALRPFLGSL